MTSDGAPARSELRVLLLVLAILAATIAARSEAGGYRAAAQVVRVSDSDTLVARAGPENCRSLLNHAFKGTYVSVEPFHLFRYLDEQAFRLNQRAISDAQRFVAVSRTIFGRRLTYKGLTGAFPTTPA